MAEKSKLDCIDDICWSASALCCVVQLLNHTPCGEDVDAHELSELLRLIHEKQETAVHQLSFGQA